MNNRNLPKLIAQLLQVVRPLCSPKTEQEDLLHFGSALISSGAIPCAVVYRPVSLTNQAAPPSDQTTYGELNGLKINNNVFNLNGVCGWDFLMSDHRVTHKEQVKQFAKWNWAGVEDARTPSKPGHPKFDQMLDRIQNHLAKIEEEKIKQMQELPSRKPAAKMR